MNDTLKLEGDQLDVVREFLELSDEISELLDDIKKEMEERNRAVAEAWQEAVSACFDDLRSATGIPDMDSNHWRLDLSYLREHGVAFAIRTKKPNPSEVDLFSIEPEGTG